jgi:hypothetical protein
MRAALALLMMLGVAEAAPLRLAERPATPQAKCTLYRDATAFTLKRRGTRGLSPEFLARHAGFIEGGCIGAHDACPRTAEELDFANTMVVLSMNAGMASTFAPFGCPK